MFKKNQPDSPLGLVNISLKAPTKKRNQCYKKMSISISIFILILIYLFACIHSTNNNSVCPILILKFAVIIKVSVDYYLCLARLVATSTIATHLSMASNNIYYCQ